MCVYESAEYLNNKKIENMKTFTKNDARVPLRLLQYFLEEMIYNDTPSLNMQIQNHCENFSRRHRRPILCLKQPSSQQVLFNKIQDF